MLNPEVIDGSIQKTSSITLNFGALLADVSEPPMKKMKSEPEIKVEVIPAPK